MFSVFLLIQYYVSICGTKLTNGDAQEIHSTEIDT
jgi:hypothetical protein